MKYLFIAAHTQIFPTSSTTRHIDTERCHVYTLKKQTGRAALLRTEGQNNESVCQR